MSLKGLSWLSGKATLTSHRKEKSSSVVSWTLLPPACGAPSELGILSFSRWFRCLWWWPGCSLLSSLQPAAVRRDDAGAEDALLRRSALSSWFSPARLTLQVISWVRKTTRMQMKQAHYHVLFQADVHGELGIRVWRVPGPLVNPLEFQ